MNANVTAYLQKVFDAFAPEIHPSPGTQAAVFNWIAQYTLTSGLRITMGSLPQVLGCALKQMYALATVRVDDTGADLFNTVMADPHVPRWGLCGESSLFMYKALKAFGIKASPVAFYQSAPNTHVGIEFFSTVFNKNVFWDALYGAVWLDADGVPAGSMDILTQAGQHGFTMRGTLAVANYLLWNCAPVQFLSPSVPGSGGHVQDPRYQDVVDWDYWDTIGQFVNALSVYPVDAALDGGLLPGEARASKVNLMFIQPTMLAYSSIAAIRAQYSADQGGYDRLFVYQMVA